MVKVPVDTELFESEIATYWFDGPILISLSKSPKRTVENITANVKLIKSITNNNPVPLLIYLSNSPVPDKQTRDLANRELPNIYKAMAMVSSSGLGKVIMNFLFKLQKPPIPIKSFSNDKAARDWLQQFI